MQGVGPPVRLARPIKWIKRQVASGLKEGETHYLTRKHHYDLVSRGSSGIVVVSRSGGLFTNALDQHPLPPLPAVAVKLPVQDPLPGAKVEPAVGHRHHR
jgi:hypothetical protein